MLQWIKDINEFDQKWEIKGFIDDNPDALRGYACDSPILGSVADWQPSQNEVFACGIADPFIKEQIILSLKARGALFEQIIHPKASIGSFNTIGEGVVIYPNAVITVNTIVGDYTTILSAGIGHDCKVGRFTTIGSRCLLNGNVEVGERVFVGAGAIITPGRKVQDDAFIAAGSVVLTNVKRGTRVMGNPAKKYDL